MDGVLIAFEILGALGVFLLGMKTMSEALQRVAGARMRELLSRMTSNRVSGVVTGFLTTAVVQSSSATTVMVVTFVNAGLLTLVQAIGVIMGANIGTTVTGWLVALLGFKVKLSAFALPAVAVGMGMTFARRRLIKNWGTVLLGFGLLFLGLSLMKKAVPALSGDQVGWLREWSGEGLGSMVLFVLIGTILTIVLQSSSTTMTLTLTVTASGWIPYELAAAMILGENIGTTVTANLASIGTSPAAKRAARAHALFNLVGVAWALVLMRIALLPAVDALMPGDPMAMAGAQLSEDEIGVVTAHLAGFHTLFNIVNTTLLLGFVNPIARAVTRMVPTTSGPQRAKHLSGGVVETPELGLELVRRELKENAGAATSMLDSALRMLVELDAPLGAQLNALGASEEQLRAVAEEIFVELVAIAEQSLGERGARELAAATRDNQRLERLATLLRELAELGQTHRRMPSEEHLPATALDELGSMGALVRRASTMMAERVDRGPSADGRADALEAEINRTRSELHGLAVGQISASELTGATRRLYFDAVALLEELGDHVLAVGSAPVQPSVES